MYSYGLEVKTKHSHYEDIISRQIIWFHSKTLYVHKGGRFIFSSSLKKRFDILVQCYNTLITQLYLKITYSTILLQSWIINFEVKLYEKYTTKVKEKNPLAYWSISADMDFYNEKRKKMHPNVHFIQYQSEFFLLLLPARPGGTIDKVYVDDP